MSKSNNVIILLFIILITSTVTRAQTLSDIAKITNDVCPVKGRLFTIKKASYANNIFFYYLELDGEKSFNVQTLLAKQEKAREWCQIITAFAFFDNRYAIKRMIEKKVNFKILIDDTNYYGTHEIVFSPQQLQEIIRKYERMNINLLCLENQAIITNIQAPYKIDNISTLLGAHYDDFCFEYIYQIDDTIVKMKDFEKLIESQRQNHMRVFYTDYSGHDLFKACVETGRYMKCTYKGKNSGDKVTMYFKRNEMAKFIK